MSPRPLGQACWRCLVVPVLLWLGAPLGIPALGGDVLHPLCFLFGERVVYGLCLASGGVPWMGSQCSAHMVWVGVFSLCGCDMMSGLPFQI